jgi:plastocyanin
MFDSLSRRARTFPVVSLAIVLVTLAAVPSSHSVLAQSGATVEVQVIDFAFEPAMVMIEPGTTVTWTNTGDRPHTVTADDGSFDSGRLDPGEQFSFTFTEPGTFTYVCGFHPEMQGSVMVAEAQGEGGEGGEGGGESDGIEVATATPGEAPSDDEAPAASDAAGPVQNLSSVEQSRLAHIHAGTCDELGIVVYSFPDIRTYEIAEGDDGGVGAIELITGTTQTELGNLFGEPFSIHIHESAQNKQRYLACSDIGGQPAAPWSASDGLTLQATEQQDSGFSGFTTLRPAPNGGTQVTVVLAASSSATEAAAALPEPPPSDTYTSPTFGYTIGYGPTWDALENVSSNGRDRFVLFNGTSYITFTGAREFGGDPQACVDAFVEQLTADPAVSNLGLATDEEGNPLQGGTEATGSYAIFNHDYAFSDRTAAFTLFVGCVPLIPNEAVLAIVQNVPTDQFNDQVEPREALMRGLTLDQ